MKKETLEKKIEKLEKESKDTNEITKLEDEDGQTN